MSVADSADQHSPSPLPDPHLGGNGQALLERPIRELTDDELARAKEAIRDTAKLKGSAWSEAEAASARFQKIIEEIETLPENEFEIRSKDIAKRNGVSVALLRKWWRQMHQETTEWKSGGGRRVELPAEATWPKPVVTSDALNLIMTKLREHVVLDSGGALAVSLYTMMSYVV
jgi:hypothetical protein